MPFPIRATSETRPLYAGREGGSGELLRDGFSGGSGVAVPTAVGGRPLGGTRLRPSSGSGADGYGLIAWPSARWVLAA